MGNNFTDIASTDPVIAATINDRLDELDQAIKVNAYAKTAAPTANDDSADGYSVGSRWIDTTNDRMYIAVDVSAGAAIWLEIASDKILLPAPAFYIAEGSPAFGTIGGTSGRGTATWLLDAGSRERVGASVEYRGQRSGSSANVDLWWAMESATSGNVVFLVQVAPLAHGEDATTLGLQTSSGEVAVPGTAKTLQKTTINTPCTFVPGNLLRITICRNAADGSDTATGDLHFIAATIRF